MKWTFDWQDLNLFLAVARGGGLAGAVAETGLSPATLGRRMTTLERDLEQRLFVRGARGYGLTEAGRSLLERAMAMDGVATDIARWRDGLAPLRRVRISAGTWTAQLMADNLGRYWSPDDPWVPEFLAADARLDIARREADIGVRNRRPDTPWLAGRQVGSVTYAAYRATAVPDPDHPAWIGVAGDHVLTPTARWTAEHHGRDIVATVNDPRLALSLARQGVGRMVLPCFVGESFGDLTRCTDILADLTSPQWLVMHQDDRHRPPIRSAIEALAAFLSREDRALRP